MTGCAIALAALLVAAVPASPTPVRSRAEFARALSSVREGMTAAAVRKLIGEPDAPTTLGFLRRITLPPGHALRAEWVDAAGKRSEGRLAP